MNSRLLPFHPSHISRACTRPYRRSTLDLISSSVRRHHTGVADKDQTTPLPPSFRSLYRLFLRATSASVLAHPKATNRLRRLWRPIFDEAARVIRQIDDDRLPASQRNSLVRWYMRWERRVDNTLSLLYRSAVSGGLPHRVTQNLSHMIDANATLRSPIQPSKRPWRGQLPPDAPEYRIRPVKPLPPAQVEAGLHFHRARRLLGELVGMAEGWSGISLGRTQQRR
ncbi:hypothetical protein GY45DRAFT_1272526 [Cubamyces sp. BRFM 1775]|nr:hypothetical protein GY45DRAFT_1272526 [Cubamyces sp. BRFM 1775]